MKKALLSIFFILSTALSINAYAAEPDPAGAKAVVEKSINALFSDLNANHDAYEKNTKLLEGVIDSKILPYFDLQIMSRYVLGQNWNDATPEQRKEFRVSFKDLMMRTYSAGLLGYAGTKVEYGNPTPVRKGRTKVTATLITKDGKKTPLEISLYHKDDTWKGYDVSLDGLSLITSFRSSIGDEVASKGIAQVIKEMQDLNAKGETYEKK